MSFDPTVVRRHRAFETGFTLVELLVAMTLLGFLTVLLFGGLRFGTRNWDYAQRSYDDDRMIAKAQETLRQELQQAYALPVPANDEPAHIAFEGTAHELHWLSAVPTATGAMTLCRLFVQDGGGTTRSIGITSRPELSPGSWSPVRSLLGGVVAMEFDYYGQRRGEKLARWDRGWKDQPRLPSLIRMRVGFQNKRRLWPEFVVAPRNWVNTDCAADSITSNCRVH